MLDDITNNMLTIRVLGCLFRHRRDLYRLQINNNGYCGIRDAEDIRNFCGRCLVTLDAAIRQYENVCWCTTTIEFFLAGVFFPLHF
jgi:hypothetical protein